jgi:hypothetical protein
MERRNLLKAVGGIAVTASASGVGVLAMSGGAAAQSSFTIGDSSVTLDDGDVSKIGVQLSHEVSWDGFDIPVEAASYTDTIELRDGNGNTLDSATIFDNSNNPVLLEGWSSEGSGGDGWGGAGEYTSGPGTEGSVNADLDWTVLSDDPAGDGGTETPGDIDDFGIENPTDGSEEDFILRYTKTVTLFTTESNGGTAVSAADGTTVYQLGVDDGTVGEVVGQDNFTVTVGNQEATTSSGTTSPGTSSAQ